MPSITKHPLRGHGTFDPASVGLYQKNGTWYYHVVSSTHEDDGPYEIEIDKAQTHAVACTCADYVEYRKPRGDICKHMLGINHLLELKNERIRYEATLAALYTQLQELQKEIETLRWRYELT